MTKLISHLLRSAALGCSAAAMSLASASAQEPPRPIDTRAFGKTGSDCAELRYADFSKVDEAITQITEARPVEAANGAPAHCLVEGYVWRSTRFRLRFPLTEWSGKMVFIGGGGQLGSLPNEGSTGGRSAALLQKNYATVAHDGGHFSTITDAKWAYNNEPAQIDFGFRSAHLVTVASKAVLKTFFGRGPDRAYFNGCSNSGREAMMMVQRFPLDYDGVIAGAPSMAVTDLFINMYWASNLLRDQSRTGFDMAAARTLNAGVVAQCDKLDGTADGILEDPRRCKVDFKPLLCKDVAAEGCLTPRQADIARQIYEGPRTPDGQQIAPSSAYPGSEISWIAFITPRWTIDYPNEVLRYSAFSPAPGPNWTPDPAQIADYATRMGVSESLAGATNPDIRKFKARGGKLLAYYGWNDAFGGANAISDYYETAERVMGGEKATQDFFRLFMVPGMDHCGGGVGAYAIDWLDVLDKWVTAGVAPESVTGVHPGPDGKPQFTRTIRPYRSAGRR